MSEELNQLISEDYYQNGSMKLAARLRMMEKGLSAVDIEQIEQMQIRHTTVAGKCRPAMDDSESEVSLQEQMSGLNREELLSQGFVEPEQFPAVRKQSRRVYYFTPEELAESVEL